MRSSDRPSHTLLQTRTPSKNAPNPCPIYDELTSVSWRNFILLPPSLPRNLRNDRPNSALQEFWDASQKLIPDVSPVSVLCGLVRLLYMIVFFVRVPHFGERWARRVGPEVGGPKGGGRPRRVDARRVGAPKGGGRPRRVDARRVGAPKGGSHERVGAPNPENVGHVILGRSSEVPSATFAAVAGASLATPSQWRRARLHPRTSRCKCSRRPRMGCWRQSEGLWCLAGL